MMAAGAEMRRRRAAQDFKYFCGFVRIQSQRSQAENGEELFHLFDYQQEVVDVVEASSRSIFLKCRQVGMTTLFASYVLWHVLYRPNAVVLMLNKTRDDAAKNLDTVKFMFERLPDELKSHVVGLKSDAQDKFVLRFADGSESRVRSLSYTAAGGAGETASLVVLDEFGVGKGADKAWRALSPTTMVGGTNSKLVILSTARGAYNLFARLFRGAQSGKNGFGWHFIPWTRSVLMGATEAERRAAYERERSTYPGLLSEFYAEFPASVDEAFSESGNKVFRVLPPVDVCPEYDLRVRAVTKESTQGEFLSFESDQFAPLRVRFEEPDRDAFYVISVDPSMGIELDYQAAHVMHKDDDGVIQLSAYVHSNTIQDLELAQLVYQLGYHYRGKLPSGAPQKAAMLVLDRTGGYGKSLLNELRSLGYPVDCVARYRDPNTRSRQKASQLGLPVSKTTKPAMVRTMVKLVGDEERPCVIDGIHPMLRDEMDAFVQKPTPGGQSVAFEADGSENDDLVMTVAMGVWVLDDISRVATAKSMGEELPAPKADDYLAEVLERVKRKGATRRRREERASNASIRRTLRTAARRAR